MVEYTRILIFALCILQVYALPATIQEEEFAVSLNTLNGEFSLHWKALDVNGNITYDSSLAKTYVVGIQANGTGWIAWGMSDMAMMMDADMIIGGVDDSTGHVYINDYWAIDTTAVPALDTAKSGGSYNILEYNGSQANGMTTLLFKRSFGLTDKWDLNPKSSTGMVIAFHNYLDQLVYSNSHTVKHASGFTVPFFTDSLACPNNCSSRGTCLPDGTCNCKYGYGATDCSIVVTCYSAYECNYNGECHNYECVCDPGWTGSLCNTQAYTLSAGFGVDHYSNHVEVLGGDLKMYWAIQADFIEVTMVAKGTGWIGFGLGKTMTNADIIMGKVENGATTINDFWSFTQASPRSDSLLGGDNNILASAGQEINGVTTIKFIRLLESTDKYDVDITEGDNSVILAYNANSDSFTSDHGPGRNTPVTINFYTGSVTLGSKSLKIVHAVFMTLGWSVFVVAAIIIARHFKKIGHLWFQLHILFNMIGIALILIGFIISFVMVTTISLVNDTRPVVIAHAWIGLFSVALGLVQPLIGWYSDKVYDKDRKSIPVWPDKVHWWIGRVGLLLSFVAVPLGMVSMDISRAFVWIYIAYIVVLFTVFIMLQKTQGNKHEMELKTLKDSQESQ